MNQVKFRFSQAAIISVVFAIIGVLFALADIVNYAQLGRRFTPFSVAYPVSAQTYDETQLYVPGARRFFENNSVKTEVDVFELRDAVGAYPVAHSIVIGSIAKLFGSLEVAWVIAHAFFPASIWLLFFFCARSLHLPVASAVLLATATCLVPFGPRNFFLLGKDALIQPLELARLPHPGLSFAFLLLAIMGVSQAVASGTIIAGIGAGFLIGVNFYSYYFYWMSIGLGLSMWLGAAASLRRWTEVKVLCVVGLAAAVTGLPFLGMVAIGLRSPTLKNLMERVGSFSRDLSPTGLWLALIFTGAAIWLYARGRTQPLTMALIFALAGGALGLNVHLLTGYDAQHGHFMNRCVQPIFFFLFGAVVLLRLPSMPRRWPWLYTLATLILVGLGVYRQVRVAGATAESHDRTENSVQLIEILRGRITDGSVVGCTDPQVLTLLPAISTLWTFVPLGDRTQASNDEILRRFLLLRKLEGKTISDVHADFEQTYPSKKEDRNLSYVLFLHGIDGKELHDKIDLIWPELDVAEVLLHRRLDVLVMIGIPPALSQSTGWQLVKDDPVGKWSIFHMRRTDS
jgi:hypothetical protein